MSLSVDCTFNVFFNLSLKRVGLGRRGGVELGVKHALKNCLV
jgi:hypothetical protein